MTSSISFAASCQSNDINNDSPLKASEKECSWCRKGELQTLWSTVQWLLVMNPRGGMLTSLEFLSHYKEGQKASPIADLIFKEAKELWLEAGLQGRE